MCHTEECLQVKYERMIAGYYCTGIEFSRKAGTGRHIRHTGNYG